MEEVLTLGGKQYIKASTIARELGYTSDYVGQLCRSRKVNAKLVGRSWYVDSDSIQSHKGTRYRSTQAKSAKELREQVGESVLEAPARFYTHNKPLPKVAYEQDESELIPKVQKKVELPVELADAEKLTIKEEATRYHFITPKVPKIKFQGTLEVSEYEGATEAVEATEKTTPKDDGSVHLHPRISKEESKKKPTNIAISSVHTSTFITKLAHAGDEGTSTRSVLKSHKKGTISVVSTDETEVAVIEEESKGIYLSFVTSGALLGMVLAVLFLGLESHIAVAGSEVRTDYSFGIDHLALTASAYQSVASFSGTASGILYLINFSTHLLIF